MFLKNAWYVAARKGEQTESLFHRRILDEPVLIYRQRNGVPVAISDRCAHRFAPLHMGRLDGDVVECAYHGPRFDGTGACFFNPHGDGKIPNAARIKSYPVIERHSLLWIWMGDASRVDSTLIPDYSFLTDKKRGVVGGYVLTQAHYGLLIDNLLDLSHTQFLHRGFQDAEGFLQGRHEVVEQANSIQSNTWAPNAQPPAFFAGRLSDTGIMVDLWADMRLDAPSCLRLDTGVTPTGTLRDNGVSSISSHILTPETDSTTHSLRTHALITSTTHMPMRQFATGKKSALRNKTNR